MYPVSVECFLTFDGAILACTPQRNNFGVVNADLHGGSVPGDSYEMSSRGTGNVAQEFQTLAAVTNSHGG